MRLAVLDCETTGLETQDQIVELAALICTTRVSRHRKNPVTTLTLDRVFQTLVRPTVPVQPEARASHHITDRQLSTAPSMRQLALDGHLAWLNDPNLIVVAHNLPFDQRMLDQTLLAGNVLMPRPRGLDTLQAARHLWPEGKHGNQVLRYRLNLDVRGVERIGPPHRALPDCIVTLALLREMLKYRTVAELLELSGLPVLQVTCQIGKFKGVPWAEVDHGMLRWILDRDFDDNIKHTARHYLNGGS